MNQLATLDWAIVILYLLFALAAGIVMSRLAGRSIESYFVAGRQLPWWWLGTSMVATTFAADTPLAITGIVANEGISGNWFWWSWALAYVSIAVIFAALWRRARVITDAELVELRYAGRSAALLRAFKAVFFAIVINGIILGWVITAMSKITAPFVDWSAWLGTDRYQAIEAIWPTWLLFGTLSETLTILALFGLVTLYSTLGGIRGVILTDLFQFAIAIIASVTFAYIAVAYVGGMGGLVAGLELHYPDTRELLTFLPRADAGWFPVQAFVIYIAVMWWAQYYADGSGYLAQRLNTARDDQQATGGALWFVIANFGLRTWPWILIALVALVIYPLGAETGPGADLVAADREMGYPVLMARLLPVGLLGLMFASLLAAFMSTVDTHINWGTSYLVNDVYRRFLRPTAGQRELVRVSRLCVVGLAVLAVFIASQIDSIEAAWRFFIALGAGLGLPGMLRWLWWRTNAWTEIAGMTAATLAAVVLYTAFPDVHSTYLLLAIVAISTTAALTATFLTPPVDREHLERFVRRVRPPGAWNGMRSAAPVVVLHWLLAAWVLGNVAVFSLTFGVGHLLLGSTPLGALLLLVGGGSVLFTLGATRRARLLTPEAATEPAATAGAGAAVRPHP